MFRSSNGKCYCCNNQQSAFTHVPVTDGNWNIYENKCQWVDYGAWDASPANMGIFNNFVAAFL